MGSVPRGISASRGAAVLGFSEFQTPLEVFQRIMEERSPGWNHGRGYALPEEPESAALRWGTAFEGAVIKLAEKARGMKIRSRERFFSSGFSKGGEECVTCHIDGRYSGGGPRPLHEGKTTSAFAFREKWGAPGTDHIPRAYKVQAQHQMMLAGAEEAVISVLVFPETQGKFESSGWEAAPAIDGKGFILANRGFPGGARASSPEKWADALAEMGFFHQYEIKAEPEAQRMLKEAYREFWERNVLEGRPPQARNLADLERLFPEPKSTIVVPEYIERKLAEYKGITEETARSKKRKERLKTLIVKYAAERGGVLDDESKEAVIFRSRGGEKLGSWGRNKNGSFVFRS